MNRHTAYVFSNGSWKRAKSYIFKTLNASDLMPEDALVTNIGDFFLTKSGNYFIIHGDGNSSYVDTSAAGAVFKAVDHIPHIKKS